MYAHYIETEMCLDKMMEKKKRFSSSAAINYILYIDGKIKMIIMIRDKVEIQK
jgi:hypothetical protein